MRWCHSIPVHTTRLFLASLKTLPWCGRPLSFLQGQCLHFWHLPTSPNSETNLLWFLLVMGKFYYCLSAIGMTWDQPIMMTFSCLESPTPTHTFIGSVFCYMLVSPCFIVYPWADILPCSAPNVVPAVPASHLRDVAGGGGQGSSHEGGRPVCY